MEKSEVRNLACRAVCANTPNSNNLSLMLKLHFISLNNNKYVEKEALQLRGQIAGSRAPSYIWCKEDAFQRWRNLLGTLWQFAISALEADQATWRL